MTTEERVLSLEKQVKGLEEKVASLAQRQDGPGVIEYYTEPLKQEVENLGLLTRY